MTDDQRAEQYPSLPAVDWAAKCKQRDARRVAVDKRNELIGQVGTARAVAVVGGGSIGGAKVKEAKKP